MLRMVSEKEGVHPDFVLSFGELVDALSCELPLVICLYGHLSFHPEILYRNFSALPTAWSLIRSLAILQDDDGCQPLK